jgi:salicylate hydroxylase
VGGGIGGLTTALSLLRRGIDAHVYEQAGELSEAGGQDPAAALRRYEAARIPRTTRIQAMSTANKTQFHLPDGPEQRERDAQMSTGTTDLSLKAMAWIYDHDAAS